ncbi:MAG TPA: hypothetical protein PKD72_12895, partial [Gemmatales bacterium]|nr:hypothetical protein [Gemmatales bacterium]
MLHLRSLLLVPMVLLTGLSLQQAKQPPVGKPLDFNRQILPILSDHCFACHGPDESTRKADLRLDTKAGLFGKIDEHLVVKPNDPDGSLLFERIMSTEKDKV